MMHRSTPRLVYRGVKEGVGVGRGAIGEFGCMGNARWGNKPGSSWWLRHVMQRAADRDSVLRPRRYSCLGSDRAQRE